MMKGPLFWVAWIGTAVFGVRAFDYVMQREWRRNSRVDVHTEVLLLEQLDREADYHRLMHEAQSLKLKLEIAETKHQLEKKQ